MNEDAKMTARPRPYRLRALEPSEAQIQSAILDALAVHPAVAGFWRQNTGAVALGEGKDKRFVRFGPIGSPDIHGYLKDGRALFIEVKRPSGRVSADQQAFIDRASACGSVAFVARSVADVWAALSEQGMKQ
jgi:hypothetical protein